MKKTKSVKADKHGFAKIEMDREDIIENFLNANDTPQTFGQINAYLEEIDCAYPNHKKDRTGLAHALLRMIKKKRIEKLEKSNNDKYPRYRSFSKSTFDASFDGYTLKQRSIKQLFSKGKFLDDYIKKNEKTVSTDTIIKKLVPMLGVHILYMLLCGSTRPISTSKSEEDNLRNQSAWLRNALSLNDPVDGYSEKIYEIISDKQNSELINALENHYPDIIKQMKKVENQMENNSELIKQFLFKTNLLLRKSPY